MDRQARINLAKSLCTKHHCNEQIRQIHFDQIVNRGWHPHPPQQFITWWKSHPESKFTTATKAFNCQLYQEQFSSLIPP